MKFLASDNLVGGNFKYFELNCVWWIYKCRKEIKLEKEKTKNISRRSQSDKKRRKNLMLATDSAINRLEELTRPGGGIEEMDIKELKNLISSIKELASVSLDLGETRQSGGIVVLPEVNISD